MISKRWWIAGGAALAAVVAAVVVTVVLTTGGGGTSATTPAEYAALWDGTHAGATEDAVLAKWPKPYQVYKDSFGNQCYEWWNKPKWLYSLCFKRHVLITKNLG